MFPVGLPDWVNQWSGSDSCHLIYLLYLCQRSAIVQVPAPTTGEEQRVRCRWAN
jgi:hypothetical protein